MFRAALAELVAWKEQADRLPLLMRGARQVGKTHLLEMFGEAHFDEVFKINFEQQRDYLSCFSSLSPQKILQMIYVISGKTITPGKTLLFLDEIQECPDAILSLRYFYEQMPALHVVAAGSLLEFTMREPGFKMPVGRIQSCYLKPMSFQEFLVAAGKKSLEEYIKAIGIDDMIEPAVHQTLLSLLKEYIVLGGMPAVLRQYFTTSDMAQCQTRQQVIMDNYRNDFAKYAKHTDIKYLQKLFDKAPGLVGKHFKYVAVDPHMQSRFIKRAVTDLTDAGVIYPIHASNAAGLPLQSTMNEKKFKLLFVDVGLVNSAMQLSAKILMDEDITLLNQGAIAEQFVGQELLAYASTYQKEQLFYWEREQPSSTAEVDYLINVNANILPIEVKSGATGRLRSLQIFIDAQGIDFGVRLSQNTLSFKNRVLSIPLYMVSELPRLVVSA